eukprot:c22032_g1_i1 orf=171-2171(+)
MASHDQSKKDESALVSGGEEEEAEYESDSEGGTSALALRRRVASDVEDDDQEVPAERDGAYSDDGGEEDQGAPPDEDDEEEEEEEEEYEDTEQAADLTSGRRGASAEDDIGVENFKHQGGDMEYVAAEAPDGSENATGSGSKDGPEEEKQNSEPFVVPTAGAFYMHDDRFRNNGVVRPRRSAGGRKLWEAKDEKRWVHDRFEELKLSEESNPPQGGRGRRGRGREGRGQGRGRDLGSGRGRGGRDTAAEEAFRFPNRLVRGRGRGLRRARMDDYEFREAKPAGNWGESRASSTPKPTASQPTGKPEEAASKKPTTSSVLNSKSPPFFPTGAGTHNIKGGQPGTSKGAEDQVIDRDTTHVGSVGSTSRSGMEKEITRVSPTSVTRSSSSSGNIVSVVPDSSLGEVRSLPRGPNTMQQQLPKTGSGSMLQQQRPVRAEGSLQHMLEQSSLSSACQQTARGTPSQFLRMQQPQQQVQTITQGQVSRGQPVQSQSLVSPISLSGQQAVDSKGAPLSPGNKMGNVASGRVTQAATVPAGRGAFMYGGSSLTNGLRSVGVALPGYSSQPQFGFPNSEVTWIPILAGGGSLGSNYSSSYIAVDGSSPAVYYTPQASHTQQASQNSAFPVPGRETNSSKTPTSGSFKPPARSEADEFGQQRRRYSQMTFGEERR